jgi:ATP-dependent DNA helicase RecG
MPPINQAMLQKPRVVARDYRNRKIGGFFKELKLTEGRGTGLPIIHKSLEENGSPPPVFETDENNYYFLCVLLVHPLATSILGQEDDLRWDIDKSFIFNSLKELDSHLRSQKTLQRDQVEPKLLKLI